MIEVFGLAKYFGRLSALRALDLTVKPGEFIALFGRNGAGKTTLLRILAGLSHQSAGTVNIQPEQTTKPRYTRGCIGYLSHNTALYVDLTALENLRFYAQLLGLATSEEFLVGKIDEVGLRGREGEPVRNYSRGMQQRLALARAFLHDPEILLLDEPFTGLDQAGSDFLKRYLMEAHSKGKTCLMAIHDAQLGYEMADRFVVIDKGVAALDVTRAVMSFAEFSDKYSAIVNRA
jgi:heme ABC exporter ATP-binding subunit CcmA